MMIFHRVQLFFQKNHLLLLLGIALVRNSASRESIANPYYSGCLHEKLEGWSKKRVCARDDPPEAVGVLCREPSFDSYLEIRIATGNWNSATALGWLTQIILSEILGVPSSIESGAFGTSRDFYDAQARLDYNRSVNIYPLITATDLAGGDCRSLQATSSDNYEPCAHFAPEFWGNPLFAIDEQKVEPPQGIGFLGQEAWFMTQFTADQDPTLVSHHGLQGEKNREKLAATFKRPTTWKDYCEQVSLDNCKTPNEVAQRPPLDDNEATRMFMADEYTGHFRYTDQNNCTLTPNCTGHIANYPCGWKSFMEANIYHMDIALDPRNGPGGAPGGYTTQQLEDMWHAANATKSNLMMMWWTPTPLHQHFVGSDAEFQRVLLKPYSLVCEKARKNVDEHSEECSEDFTIRVGEPDGACDFPAEPLRKFISAGLFDDIHSPEISEAERSPAYDVLRRFQISELQLGELFDLMESEVSPRDAVCTWAAANMAFLESTVPFSYPRVTQGEEHPVLGYVALGLGSLAAFTVSMTACMVYQKRDKRSIQYAQLDFLSLLLAGAFLVCIGSILLSVPASDAICLSSLWFIYVGYTVELVPLIIKVAAVNKMMSAARNLRRISLARRKLYKAVALITVLLCGYLAVWSAMDPLRREAEYSLTGSNTGDGDRIVETTYYCSAEKDFWQYIAIGWNAVLLLCASVLAYQTRGVVSGFNESRTLAFLIYSHSVFVILRIATFLLSDDAKKNTLEYVLSILLAADQVATCGIYFWPKLAAADHGDDTPDRSSVIFVGNNHASRSHLSNPSNAPSPLPSGELTVKPNGQSNAQNNSSSSNTKEQRISTIPEDE